MNRKIFDYESSFTFWPISKQTADFYKMSFHKNDRLLMLYVLASIVFLYHQWLRWDFEMLDWLLHQPGVLCFVMLSESEKFSQNVRISDFLTRSFKSFLTKTLEILMLCFVRISHFLILQNPLCSLCSIVGVTFLLIIQNSHHYSLSNFLGFTHPFPY